MKTDTLFLIRLYDVSVGSGTLCERACSYPCGFYSVHQQIISGEDEIISNGPRIIKIGLWHPKEKMSSATAVGLINHIILENNHGLRLHGRPAIIEELVACQLALFKKLGNIKVLALGEKLDDRSVAINQQNRHGRRVLELLDFNNVWSRDMRFLTVFESRP